MSPALTSRHGNTGCLGSQMRNKIWHAWMWIYVFVLKKYTWKIEGISIIEKDLQVTQLKTACNTCQSIAYKDLELNKS